MLNAEHLIENAVCALEKYEVQEAYRQFMESPCNIELAENAGIRLDDVWVMAVYCDTTLRTDWKEKWEKEAERWIPVIDRDRTEAIKEFAETLKGELTTGVATMRGSVLNIIDSLVEEMTEVHNEP